MIAGIHHATFLTSDLARSRAFYEGVLDLQLAGNRPQMSFDGVWYDIGQNQQIHLMLLPDPDVGVHRPAHGGRDRHVALGVKDLSGLKARLDGSGIACTQSQSGRNAVFCRDPDGNALEFIEIT
ncbi:MAG: VOC family protein [Nitrosomonadales bacterium]|nr:VOC family protein [Nitrosomonadales bacterium]